MKSWESRQYRGLLQVTNRVCTCVFCVCAFVRVYSACVRVCTLCVRVSSVLVSSACGHVHVCVCARMYTYCGNLSGLEGVARYKHVLFFAFFKS